MQVFFFLYFSQLNMKNYFIQDQSSSSIIVTIQVSVGIIVITSIISNLTSVSSVASLWATINQLQLLFFLILTNAFLPEAVINVILGSKFALVISGKAKFIFRNSYAR